MITLTGEESEVAVNWGHLNDLAAVAMSVIPFSKSRFTPTDLVEFFRAALPRCARGEWSTIARRTGRNRDSLDIFGADARRPILTFERGADGGYRLFRYGAQGPECVASEAAAAACLMLLRDRPVRRRLCPAGSTL